MSKKIFSYGHYIHTNLGKTNKNQRIHKIKQFLDERHDSISYDQWLLKNKDNISRVNQFNNFFKRDFYTIPYHEQYESRDFTCKKEINFKNIDNYKKFYNKFNPYLKSQTHVSPNLGNNLIDYYKYKYQQK
jgi:hypothetical protein